MSLCLFWFALIIGPWFAWAWSALFLLFLFLTARVTHKGARNIFAGFAITAIIVGGHDLRQVNRGFLDYHRFYPSLFDAFSRPALRTYSIAFADFQIHTGIDQRALITRREQWISDSVWIPHPVLETLAFANATLGTVTSGQKLHAATLVTKELCTHYEKWFPHTILLQPESFGTSPSCGSVLTENFPLESVDHLLTFAPFPRPSSKLATLPSPRATRWLCDRFAFQPAGVDLVTNLEANSPINLEPNRPYGITLEHAYCIMILGSEARATANLTLEQRRTIQLQLTERPA